MGDILVVILETEDAPRPLAEDVVAICNTWFPAIEAKLPDEGFVHGLEIPTAADLAVLNIANAFLPFGAVYAAGEYHPAEDYPKFAAHAARVAKHPSVAAYLRTSKSMECDPFCLKKSKVTVSRSHRRQITRWEVSLEKTLKEQRVMLNKISMTESPSPKKLSLVDEDEAPAVEATPRSMT